MHNLPFGRHRLDASSTHKPRRLNEFECLVSGREVLTVTVELEFPFLSSFAGQFLESLPRGTKEGGRYQLSCLKLWEQLIPLQR